MTNKEIFDAIEQLQYVVDKHAKSGKYEFADQDDVKLLESVYNFITKRQYIKFNAGCSSCVKEAFIILSNWQKREEAKAEQAISNPFSPENLNDKQGGNLIDMSEATPEQLDEFKTKAIEIFEEVSEVKSKPKTNGRSKRK